MKQEYSKLEEIIKEKAKAKPVYYISNPGNYGDALIRQGSLKFFKDKGIEYIEVTRLTRKILLKAFFEGATMIYAGSGAWCGCWNHAYRIISKILSFNKLFKRINIIILPSTFEYHFDLPNTTVFVRDKYESLTNMPNAIFCHDMALYLDKKDVQLGDKPGYFFRTDKEAKGEMKIPNGNIDLSTRGNERSDIYSFYTFLVKYSVIHTDRLHIAIAGCQLGREVHLYPNSYFKNKAIYYSSLKDNFKNIHFHEENDLVAPFKPAFLL